MFDEKRTSAKEAALHFVKIQTQKPSRWAENIVEASADITDSAEQVRFLQFLCNPSGKGGGTVVKTADNTNFEDCGDRFKLTEEKPGRLTLKRYKYIPDSDESDEKIE